MRELSLFELKFVIEPQVRKFCGPVFFTESFDAVIESIPNNGTFGLVDTGKKKLLVTCCHVWEEYKKLRSEKPQFQFGLCLDYPKPVSIKTDKLFIDEDKRCDLVTFNFEEALPFCRMGGLEFYNLHINRPPKVKVRDVIFLIGFPGKGRIVTKEFVNFDRQPITLSVSEVGDSHFYGDVTSLRKQSEDYGGISGAPCFVLREDNSLRLVGFAIGVASNSMNRLQFTYARYIGEDGVIRYM